LSKRGGPQAYRGARADAWAWKALQRPKPRKLTTQPKLRQLVAKKLHERWSPRQSSGWLEVKSRQNGESQVSVSARAMCAARTARSKRIAAATREVAHGRASLSQRYNVLLFLRRHDGGGGKADPEPEADPELELEPESDTALAPQLSVAATPCRPSNSAKLSVAPPQVAVCSSSRIA